MPSAAAARSAGPRTARPLFPGHVSSRTRRPSLSRPRLPLRAKSLLYASPALAPCVLVPAWAPTRATRRPLGSLLGRRQHAPWLLFTYPTYLPTQLPRDGLWPLLRQVPANRGSDHDTRSSPSPAYESRFCLSSPLASARPAADNRRPFGHLGCAPSQPSLYCTKFNTEATCISSATETPEHPLLLGPPIPCQPPTYPSPPLMASPRSGGAKGPRQPARRRVRRFGLHLVNGQGPLSSPADSGYGSTEESHPPRWPKRSRYPLPLDGPGSWDDAEVVTEPVQQQTCLAGQPKRRNRQPTASTTGPSTCSNGNIDGHESRQATPRRRRSDTPWRLDRFVPSRDPTASTTERYHTSKQPNTLSQLERLARHGLSRGAPIPVAPPPVSVTGYMANQHQAGSRGKPTLLASEVRHGGRATDTRAICDVGAGPTTLSARLRHRPGTEHRVNRGSGTGGIDVATRGGSATDDGRGHLVRRRTNARLFTMSSLVGRLSAQDDLENYHGRVASALNIDRVRRVLNFHLRQPIPPTGSTPTPSGHAWADSILWSIGGWAPGVDKASCKSAA